jgi:hypothetical protein
MAIFRDYDLSDPFSSEGPQGYSPHWGGHCSSRRRPSPANTAEYETEQPTSGLTQNSKDND